MAFDPIRRATCLGLLCLWTLSAAGCKTGLGNRMNAADESSAGQSSERLTPEGQALLQNFLNAAQLPDLRWPNFEADRSEAAQFYQSYGSELPWFRHGKPTPQAEATIRELQNAQYKGLNPEDYDGQLWAARLSLIEKLAESEMVRFDLALTVSTMRYISDLHLGRVNPRLFHFDLNIDHTNFELSDFLRTQIVEAQNVRAALAKVEPPFPVYARTETALKTYIDLARQDDGQPLPAVSKKIQPGDPYAAAPELEKKLALVGDIPQSPAYTDEIYRGALVTGVKRFQERHGLEPSGIIDDATLRELNVPLSLRARQLALAMERLRWLPHEFDRPPIVVNIPEFRLHADDDTYRWALSMKVVVGNAYHDQTPVFASQITAVTFRPYWNVPYSILRAELIPHWKKNPLYLAQNSYELVDKSGHVVSDGSMDQNIDRLLSADFRVRQIPGQENSLGLIKFEIPSPYDVYMHGTPATELFSKSRRDFSHGCIRVEDPVALAQWVLRDKAEWTESAIRAAMEGDQTFRVKLDKPLPVLILYATAVVMENGEVHFFDDIYGLDAELEQALARGYPYRSSAELPPELPPKP